ncbi:MAG TPA: hypothetical protein VEU96_11265 [Bryobacteraceae bacterium]|nr:hypothetical protein [Bryobacteraceae bacterium]
MKRKFAAAKAPLPKFRSDKEAAKYFGSHSVVQIWKQLPLAQKTKLSATLTESIRERHIQAKSPIALRLGSTQIAAAKRS